MNKLLSLLGLPKDYWLPVSIAFALCITVPCGAWIFRDAQKRGRFPWLWGLWGILSEPLPLIFYYIFVIRADKKRGKDNKIKK